MPSKVHGPASLRFWSKVRRTDSCWEWTGHIEPRTGYGKIKCRIPGDSQRKVHLTHRAAWRFSFGEIPPGLFVCHHCDNPRCVRPDHLFLGTARDNGLDKMLKGRHRSRHGLPLFVSKRGNSYGAKRWIGQKQIWLGSFATAEEAHRAAMAFEVPK